MRKIFLAFLVLILFSQLGLAQIGAESAEKLPVYIFWARGCPHCEDALPFLEGLKAEYPIEVHAYEIHDEANNALFAEMAKACGTEPRGVPAIFIGSMPSWIPPFSAGLPGSTILLFNECLTTRGKRYSLL